MTAGKKHGALSEVDGVAFPLKKSEISELEKMGLKGHVDYNASITQQLDEIAEIGKANNWSKADYAAAIDDLRRDTKQGLRKGEISCH